MGDMLDFPMSIAEAKQIIKDGYALPGKGSLIIAAVKLYDACQRETGEVTIGDAFRCVEHGSYPASLGARMLYVLTGRDGVGWAGVSPYITDRENWKSYLDEHYQGRRI